MDSLTRYLKATASELRQVTWPTQRQAGIYTAIVIAVTIIVAIYVGLFDYLFSHVTALVTGT